jgi:uncharacterized protein
LSQPGASGDSLAWHRRLVQALLSGDAFATPPAERRLITTHISSLLLEGAHAWKLRKPLVLPFLDFSTVERRRADCDEELRLNRRTAPALYLDVQPITGSVDAPRIGGAGGAIDWVLRMRRFDEEGLLDRMAHDGRLGAAHIDALAADIVHFQQALPPSPAAFGTPGSVREWALENLDELAAAPAVTAAVGDGAPRIGALREWTLSAFDRWAPLLAQRHAQGFVREGHGDLHLGNIVLVDGRPLPFDALEFNAALRHIDVASDIAFTFMDLLRHGLPRLAWRFASAWAEHGGDHAGLALLRFFAVYRALVRAKVALLRAGQGDAEAGAAFERDLALAEGLAAPRAAPPRLVLTCGLSGSGKSTVALALAEAIGGVRIRSDVERKRLFGIPVTARPDAAQAARLYGADATQRTYQRLAGLASTLLDAGLDVIVDAAFLRGAERTAFAALAAPRGARFAIVDCQAPVPVLRERLARRAAENRDASDADIAVLAQQLQWHEAPTADEAVVRLDTDTDLAGLAQRCDALAAHWAGTLG